MESATSFVKRSKTTEVPSTLSSLYAGVERYVAEHGSLPPPIGPIPSARPPSSQRQDWSAEDRAAAAALHFEPAGPTYYVYRVEPDAEGGVNVIAEGDLDADGTTSLFVLHARRLPDGRLEKEGLTFERELE